MKQNKFIKYGLIAMFLVIGIFGLNIDASALDNDYGIWCAYGANQEYFFMYTGGSKEDIFNIDTNFDELGIAIEAGRPGEAFSNDLEQNWLKSKEIINSNGDFSCPTNPFGTTLGDATNKECGTIGCHVIDVSTSYENYSCNYIGQSSGKTLSFSFVSNEQYVNGKYDITYPDGTTETLIGTQTNGNFMPNSSCEDIYYMVKDKKITVALKASGGSTNPTLGNLCDYYKQKEIEHYCSGTCSYQEMLCPEGSYGDEISIDCEGLLGDELLDLIARLLNYVQIGAPILLIVLGIVDFSQAILSDDKDALKKATSKFVKRAIICVAIFFLPLIINLILKLIDGIPKDPMCGIK